jgi:hypothetical protein
MPHPQTNGLMLRRPVFDPEAIGLVSTIDIATAIDGRIEDLNSDPDFVPGVTIRPS